MLVVVSTERTRDSKDIVQIRVFIRSDITNDPCLVIYFPVLLLCHVTHVIANKILPVHIRLQL